METSFNSSLIAESVVLIRNLSAFTNGSFIDPIIHAIEPESASASETTLVLKKVHDILIVVLLVCVMFAMGCSITWEQVWSHIQKPIGVIIGMVSQFILLPFAAFGLIHTLNLDALHATGMLILACSPGGVTSNVFTYFCEGDLSLSVTMTSISTVVALIMMPFNVWLYGRSLETEMLVIPYSKMSLSLLFLTTPVAIGMVINWKFPKFAPYLTKIGSFSGFGIIVLCQTMEIYIFPDIFNDVPLKLYVAVFILPLLGITLGFLSGSIYPLAYNIRRTIAIESGIQNVGTALTIVSLSFPFGQLRKVWIFPFLYAFSMLAVCVVMASLFQVYKKCWKSRCGHAEFNQACSYKTAEIKTISKSYAENINQFSSKMNPHHGNNPGDKQASNEPMRNEKSYLYHLNSGSIKYI